VVVGSGGCEGGVWNGALERGNLAMGGCCQVKAVIVVVNQIVVKSQALGESDRVFDNIYTVLVQVRRSVCCQRGREGRQSAMSSVIIHSDNPKPMNYLNQ
jgi:hypothetical protein